MIDRETNGDRRPTWLRIICVILCVVVGVPSVLGLAYVLVGSVFAINRLARGEEAKIAMAQSDLAEFRGAVDQFRLDCDRYPTTKEGFSVLFHAPPGVKSWQGPYLRMPVPLDPWGHPFVYSAPGPNGKDGYFVKSYGADGRPGGEGENADIMDGSD